MAAEVQVTKGYSWTEEMGIVIACLVEDEKTYLINWAKEVNLLSSIPLDLLSRAFVDPLRGNIPEEAHHRGNRQG